MNSLGESEGAAGELVKWAGSRHHGIISKSPYWRETSASIKLMGASICCICCFTCCAHCVCFRASLVGKLCFWKRAASKEERAEFEEALQKAEEDLGWMMAQRGRRSGADAAFACDFYQTRRGRRSLAPAAPRPFGNWFEAHVGSMRSFYQSGEYANGLVVTSVEINQ